MKRIQALKDAARRGIVKTKTAYNLRIELIRKGKLNANVANMQIDRISWQFRFYGAQSP